MIRALLFYSYAMVTPEKRTFSLYYCDTIFTPSQIRDILYTIMTLGKKTLCTIVTYFTYVKLVKSATMQYFVVI